MTKLLKGELGKVKMEIGSMQIILKTESIHVISDEPQNSRSPKRSPRESGFNNVFSVVQMILLNLYFLMASIDLNQTL